MPLSCAREDTEGTSTRPPPVSSAQTVTLLRKKNALRRVASTAFPFILFASFQVAIMVRAFVAENIEMNIKYGKLYLTARYGASGHREKAAPRKQKCACRVHPNNLKELNMFL